jgi:serine/threonine-protein kinase
MPLAPGTRLGPYEVLAAIGAGGMGEVYRGRDTRLNRDVALKILPDAFAADPDRLARFRREAQVLAALNHPHIAHIYGVEESSDVRALVLEFVEGETVGARIARSRLSVGEVLVAGRQVADALDAAHERGIVHRDLKPANVVLTRDGAAKVLDFGLAKASVPSDDETTMAPDPTKPGWILGTVPYMSPEQARGQVVGPRTDIWALGCLLFEMLAGHSPFERATTSETLAAILEREPDWGALPADTPPALVRIVRGCLQKPLKSRFRDAGDVRLLLDDVGLADQRSPAAPGRRWRARFFMAGVAAVLVAAVIGAWLGQRFIVRQTPVSYVAIDIRPAAVAGSLAMERTVFGRDRPSRRALGFSPDGRTVVFTGRLQDVQGLYVRALDKPQASWLAGTEGAMEPVFSPDGRWIAFWAQGRLKKIPAAGGAVVNLCDSTPTYGVSWGTDDHIVFGRAGTIWRLSADGGEPRELTKQLAGEARHLLPQMLPGGEWLIFTLQTTINDWETARIVAQSLATGERKVLVERAADATYDARGQLLYMRLGTLMAAPFVADRLQVTGGEVTVATDVVQSVNSTVPVGLDTGAGQYAVSTSGTLGYIAGSIHPDMANQLEWIGRDGSVEPIAIPPPARPFFLPRVSPDGRKLAVGTLGLRDQSIWLFDFAARTLTRLTSDGRAEAATWFPDGTHLAFALSKNGFQNLFWVSADAAASPTRITSGEVPHVPSAFTSDGGTLLINQGSDIAAVSVSAPGTPRTILATAFSERMPDLSPNGQWLAYVSNETGRDEVYVRTYPDLGNKRQVSAEGGGEPAWSRNGRKLTFTSRQTAQGRSRVLVREVDVAPGELFSLGPPRTLFELDADRYSGAALSRSYDLNADASRFLFVRESYPASGPPLQQIQVIGNWRGR